MLRDLKGKQTSSLVVIKGRRRIGKSRLCQEFGKESRTVLLTGLPPTQKLSAQEEREDFALQLSNQLAIPTPRADDWNSLFWALAHETKKGRLVIVLDEINWLGSKDPTFLPKLKSAWDLYFSLNPKLILILSGSMSAWIERNILSSTGFFGRVSLELTLEELRLNVCNHFWGKRTDQISAYEKLKVLSVTGGVPRYLEEIIPTLSAEENIHRLCFNREGILFREFDRIFSDLFSHRTPIYKSLVNALVDGPQTLEGLQDKLDRAKGGGLHGYLNDLTTSGFVSRDHTWRLSDGKESKLSHFRLSDNYLRFYLKYIQPNKGKIERNAMRNLPKWESIAGLQFENLVLQNRKRVQQLIGIDPQTVVCDNPFFQRKTSRQRGCQIDYLIQTQYATLYLVEIKFKQKEIGSSVIEELKEKISRISIPRRFSIRPVLIHVNGVAPSIEESDFFSSVLDFGQLLSEPE